MTAEAQTIPENIMAAATAVEDEIMAADLRDLDTQLIIAKAILAERERCAAIADHFSQSSLFSEWPDAARGAAYYACGDIAEAIRNPRPPVQSSPVDDDSLPF
jgi:hypothetical protein